MASLFFISAGTFNVPRAWLYFAIFFIYSVSGNLFFLKNNPELMYHRNRWRKDAKKWDRVLTPFMVLIGFHLQYVVMGLDVRFGWFFLGSNWIYPGMVLLFISLIISFWAMHKNKHFEPTVRIQADRDHQVITTGPYQFVRHPGYLGFLLIEIAIPMVIGAGAGLFNALVSGILLLIRTAREDITLKKELQGYREYTTKVRFRIIPGIW
jgi:protein-S-isoprenylcysteine O-methyltransferase Ste14